MKRQEYILVLIEYYNNVFLKEYANKHNELSFINNGEFKLSELFNYLWVSENKTSSILPTDSNYTKDFKEFCNALMNPWSKTEHLRIKISLVKKSNLIENYIYKISST